MAKKVLSKIVMTKLSEGVVGIVALRAISQADAKKTWFLCKENFHGNFQWEKLPETTPTLQLYVVFLSNIATLSCLLNVLAHVL